MSYYKVIIDNTIVDAIENPIWIKQYRVNLIVRCNVEEAMGIVSSDNQTMYHIIGASNFVNEQFDNVSVADITESEYEELKTLLDLGAEVSDPDIIPEWIEPEENIELENNQNQTLAEVKARVIDRLSTQCQQIIFNGIDVTLSNGTVKHFALEIEDQLNFITLSAMIANGEQSIPYHASGELCTYYSAADMGSIIEQATTYKTYHTTYFNSLKNWINSMTSISEIGNVQYGDTIPNEYCSSVLNDLRNLIGEHNETSS